jgi:hypothetical protein
MVIPSAAWLAVPLTVAVRRLKKPFVYAGFNNLMTDETQIGNLQLCISHQSVFHLWLKN